jgi:hypothetical protein
MSVDSSRLPTFRPRHSGYTAIEISGDVRSDEAIARLVAGEQAVPGRADRFVEPVERDDREVTLAAPSFDVAPQLGLCELLFERRSLLGAVVAPVHCFVEHLREERGIGA